MQRTYGSHFEEDIFSIEKRTFNHHQELLIPFSGVLTQVSPSVLSLTRSTVVPSQPVLHSIRPQYFIIHVKSM